MKIIHERPPNFDALVAAGFNIIDRPIFFTYGDAIYNPKKVRVPISIELHEAMHSERQLAHAGGPAGWWDQYIADDKFRLEEEILGHQAEYRSLMRGCDNRHQRRSALKQVSGRLASPLYGRLIPPALARRVLQEAV